MNSDTVAGVDNSGRRSWHLRTAILRPVSRSFYLSIRFLPQQLRERIGESMCRYSAKFFAVVELQTALDDTAKALRFLQDRLEYRAEIAR